MKIKYEFVNEETEIEVSEEWGSILLDLDRQEYNNFQKETRRHCSLNAFDNDDDIFESDINIENEVIEKETNIDIFNMLLCLTEVQRRRFSMFVNGKSCREIAQIEGVNHKQIIKSIEQARKKIKKFIK